MVAWHLHRPAGRVCAPAKAIISTLLGVNNGVRQAVIKQAHDDFMWTLICHARGHNALDTSGAASAIQQGASETEERVETPGSVSSARDSSCEQNLDTPRPPTELDLENMSVMLEEYDALHPFEDQPAQ
jgi:hypothetical protein